MRIGLASDHRGYKLKEYLKQKLPIFNYEVLDYGTNSEESTDYPDYAFALGEAVASKQVDFGVAICGSGIGISIACNKVKGIRCAKVSSVDEARLAKEHNNANIIALSYKENMDVLKEMIKTFIKTPFSNEERHARRVEKISSLEN